VGVVTMATGVLSSLFRRAPPAAPLIHVPFTAATNPYRCKRTWPPEFSQLSRKHQFRLERRYRRRTKLKWARPTWTKVTTLAQWGTILFVLVYGVLYLDMSVEGQEQGTPFDAIRRWYREQIAELGGARMQDGQAREREGAVGQKG